jgi:DNA-binding MarR family transcriptional regulator
MMSSVYIKAFSDLRKIEELGTRLLEHSAACDLTLTDAHILKGLYVEDGQHASTLARAVGRAATSFTPLLDRLEKRGLIERRPDGRDRRAVLIHLTSKGWALRGPVEDVIAAIDEEFAGEAVLS